MKKTEKYKNPPLTRVSCEFSFLRDEGNPWNLTYIGNIYNPLEKLYPSVEDRTRIVQQVGVVRPEVKITEIKETRFFNSDTKESISISDKRLEYVLEDKYLGWETVREHIVSAIQAYRMHSKQPKVSGIVFHYLNKIVIPASTVDTTSQEDIINPTNAIISFLFGKFNYLKHSSAIKDYLSLNQDLITLLNTTITQLRQIFPDDTKYGLEYSFDCEDESSQLVIVMESESTPTLLGYLRKFEDSFWLSKLDESMGRIVFEI